jgi:hypothetical protein
MAPSAFLFSARWRLSRDCCCGEPLELVARETNVSIARLTEWRERALAGAATALKERERDDRDDEIAAQAPQSLACASRGAARVPPSARGKDCLE